MAWQDRDYNREEGGPRMGPRSAMSVVTWLLVINTVIWLWDEIFGQSLRGQHLALGPYFAFTFDQGVRHFQLWRWVTYQFIHADFWHILFNMIGLYFFGPMMESWWGSRKFLVFYLLCGMSGALVFTVLGLVPGLISGHDGSLIGASGAIFGILVGSAVVAPRQLVSLIFPPVTITMRTMVLIFLGIAVIKVLADNINAGGEAAHLGGAALGFILVKYPRLLGWADRFSLPRREEAAESRWMKKQAQTRRAEESEQADVDRILDKVRDHGLHSLSRNEKKVLQRTTEKQRRAG